MWLLANEPNEETFFSTNYRNSVYGARGTACLASCHGSWWNRLMKEDVKLLHIFPQRMYTRTHINTFHCSSVENSVLEEFLDLILFTHPSNETCGFRPLYPDYECGL